MLNRKEVDNAVQLCKCPYRESGCNSFREGKVIFTWAFIKSVGKFKECARVLLVSLPGTWRGCMQTTDLPLHENRHIPQISLRNVELFTRKNQLKILPLAVFNLISKCILLSCAHHLFFVPRRGVICTTNCACTRSGLMRHSKTQPFTTSNQTQMPRLWRQHHEIMVQHAI